MSIPSAPRFRAKQSSTSTVRKSVRRPRRELILILLALTAVSAGANEAEVAANLAQNPEARGAGSDSYVRAGDRLFFLRYENRQTGLWRTDGSEAGTDLVREFDARSVTSRLAGIGLPDGRLLFAANDPAFGYEPWISDGTAAGTFPLADLCPGLCDSLGFRSAFLRFGDEVLFSADLGSHNHLFAVGAAGGPPQPVSELSPARWTVAGERIFLVTRDRLDDPYRLWVSDGRGGETVAAEFEASFVHPLVAFGSGVLLAASPEVGPDEVYFGDSQGLRRLAGGDEFRDAVAGPSLAYFTLHSGGADHLYRSDGTVAGTFELPVVAASGKRARFLTAAGDRLFFVLETAGHGREPWTSDGTAAGTELLRDLVAGSEGSDPDRFTPHRSQVIFFADGADGPALWQSDATAAGTVEIRAFEQIDRGFEHLPLGVLDELLIFAAGDSGGGLEPWASDGSEAGTHLIANLAGDEGSSFPSSFVERADDLVLVADSGDPDVEFFRLDSAGNVELAHRTPALHALRGTAGSRVVYEAREDFFFGPAHVVAFDPVTGVAEEILTLQKLSDAAVLDDRLFLASGRFFSSSITLPVDLYVTDGTAAGTVRLPADEEEHAPRDFLAWGEKLYFSATSEAAGRELWASDGTPQGTRMVLELIPGTGGSNPDLLAATADRLFLRADLGDGNRPLLAIDRNGIVRSVVPVAGDFPRETATTLGDRILWATDHFRDPEELWVSDGSAAGSFALGTFLDVGPLVASDAEVYFAAATPEHGSELWASDGSPAGTRLVRDLTPGPASSDPTELRRLESVVIFGARTPDAGVEPWVSDGTAEGTRALADVAPGPGGSRPESFVALGERLLFSAYRPDVGRELFAIDRQAVFPPCVRDAGTLCLHDGRFAVTAEWRDFAGTAGSARAVPLTTDSGYFWFFGPDNVELVVKALDGCGTNDRFWVFAGGLTDVEVELTVTDTASGAMRTYSNPLHSPFPPIQDVDAFDACHLRGDPSTAASPAAAKDGDHELLLRNGRFRVSAEWEIPGGTAGTAVAVPLTAESGYFWFFGPDNVELVVKVLDGCGFNDRFWFFAAGLTNVEVEITVTDLATGEMQSYSNPQGTRFQPILDSAAFATCP